jgi:large subunit ribosomal protein L18
LFYEKEYANFCQLINLFFYTMSNDKNTRRLRRKIRIRAKISGTSVRPRLTVYRSLKNIYAQLVDDIKGVTVVSASDLKSKSKGAKKERAKLVGETLAKLATEKGIKECVFDRNAYKFHGRVKELAEGARAGGLKF